ncbi:nuclear transport factor 2 family protein [Pseudonocardia acaciae]|uniref:nuclear transport factor 2 family protein n=1 Tax=Pseudonocardia acaciae TaxID=551276 RepID=UPI000AD0623A|nr:nuclear transport factor 2 family protein [Pseudonocardia acaciae]
MPRTPEETFRRLLELLLDKDMDGIADLWAPDGEAEFPFATGGAPTRLDGREAVRRYLDGYPDRMDVTDIPSVTVHHTQDPDTVVVEFTANGRTVSTDTPYRMDYIAVVTVKDGLIASYRDYWSPVAAARAAGTLPELLAALDATVAR